MATSKKSPAKKTPKAESFVLRLSMRHQMAFLIESPGFQRLLFLLIMGNAALLSFFVLQTHPSNDISFIRHISSVVMGIFLIELLMRLFVHRCNFFKDAWNCLDAAVILAALYPPLLVVSILRILRLMRVLKLVPPTPGGDILKQVLRHAIPMIGSIALVGFVIVFAYSLFFFEVYYHILPKYFSSFGESVYFTLTIMYGEWPEDVITKATMYYEHASLAFNSLWLIAHGLVIMVGLTFFSAAIEMILQQNRESFARMINMSSKE